MITVYLLKYITIKFVLVYVGTCQGYQSSNLHFMSKVFEKLVVKRLENHMCTNNLYDPLQSAYRSQHSTETAILKIHNDIIEGLDAGKCTVCK